ncbi:MAG: type II toxin-antitoxin system Phd/YefM family antitoxin [Spirochaetes bacterium]|nr:type II toxin-antitoxin system Phd/YefM family antitoxin [Spirochaetota bacterium]
MDTISISNLKAHLSATLKSVRAGKRVIVVDRDVPVAEISPLPRKKPGLVVRPAKKGKMSGPLGLKVSPDLDPLEHLLEERRR